MKCLIVLVCCMLLVVCSNIWAGDYVVVFKKRNIDPDQNAEAVLCSKIKVMTAMTWAWTKSDQVQLRLSMHTFHKFVELPALENLDLIEDDSIQKFRAQHNELVAFYNRFPKARPLLVETIKKSDALLNRLGKGEICDNGRWFAKSDYLKKKRLEAAEAKRKADELAKLKAKAEAEAKARRLAEEEKNNRERIAQLRIDIEKLQADINASQRDCESKLKALENIARTP